MDQYKQTVAQMMINGCTRIDMLLGLYERAIASIKTAQAAKEQKNEALFNEKMIDANRVILALHGGLNTDEYDMAVRIGQLLNFIMLRIEQQNLDEAIYFLEKLKSGFEKIREEATALEREGKIPPLSEARGLNTVA